MIFRETHFLGFYLHWVCTLNGTLSTLAIFGQTLGLTWLILTSLRSCGDGMEWRMRVMHAKVIYSSKIAQNGASEQF
jgi:hypothetical protein